MNNIEVPYMPVESFDAHDFNKKFLENLEDSEESNNDFSTEYTVDRNKPFEDIPLILTAMGMEKYIELFQNILIDTFLQLSDSDLQEIGITDPKDREIITKNLSVHQTVRNENINPDNQNDDFKIIKNVSNQLLIMQKYCAYVELQMRKHKLTDYIIDNNQSAGLYLKAFTETALIQSQLLKQSLYDGKNLDALISKTLKINNLTLPKTIEAVLNKIHNKKKNKQKLPVLKVIVAISLSLMIIFTGKRFIKT